MSDFQQTLERFEELAQELFLHENKKYTAGLLAPRFKEAASRLRYDTTINQAAFVMEQVAAKDPTREITAQDLKDLANQFYTPSTEFDTEFADLLEQTTTQVAKQAQRLDYEGAVRNVEWDGAFQKQEVSIYNDEALTSLVDPNLSYTQHELSLIQNAAQLIDDEFKGTGKVSKVSSTLVHKTPEMLLFKTTIRQASSEAEVFVPVEVSNEVPLFPQVMSTTEKVYTLDQSGLYDLSADIEAEQQYTKANHVSSLRTAEDYDIVLRNDSMGKYSEEVDEYEVSAPKTVSLGHAEIEQTLRDAVLAVDSHYSPEARSSGRELVESELQDLGFMNSQVKFDGDYDHGMTYKANLNTGLGKLSIILPVEVMKTSGVMLPPTQFKIATETQIYTLSKEAISQVARLTKKADVELHPLLFSMSYPDLKKQLKSAAHNKQHKLAQQVINIIDEKFGEYYRNAATDDYQTWLEEATASYESRCGDCTYYAPKTSQAQNDYCNLIKTAAKNVQQDDQMQICTRSTYADFDDAQVFFDNGESIKINLED